MRCSTCPTDRHELCQREGCYARLAQLRIASVDDAGERVAAVRSLLDRVGCPAPLSIEAQVTRLDVEDNDILVLRTAEKLSQEKADAFHDQVLELAQRHGVKGVTVVVLDGCTDLTIERPSTAMAHQRPRAVPQPMG